MSEKKPTKVPRERVAAQDRRRRFASAYLRHGNGTRAAEEAGYSPRGADVVASRLLGDVRVRALIEPALKRAEISSERVLDELVYIAFNRTNIKNLVKANGEATDIADLTEQEADAVADYTVDVAGGGSGDGKRERVERTRVKLVGKSDKLKALELLGKHLKMFSNDQFGAANVLQVEGKLTVEFVMPKHGNSNGNGKVPREITVPLLPA